MTKLPNTGLIRSFQVLTNTWNVVQYWVEEDGAWRKLASIATRVDGTDVSGSTDSNGQFTPEGFDRFLEEEGHVQFPPETLEWVNAEELRQRLTVDMEPLAEKLI